MTRRGEWLGWWRSWRVGAISNWQLAISQIDLPIGKVGPRARRGASLAANEREKARMKKLLTTDEHGYYGFNHDQFNPCLSVVRVASRPTTNCAAVSERRGMFFRVRRARTLRDERQVPGA